MKNFICLLSIVLLFSSCNQSSLYNKIKQEQYRALQNYYRLKDTNHSLMNEKVKLDKIRLKKSLKSIISFAESNGFNGGNFIILELNSFTIYDYEGLLFDIDKAKGYKFRFSEDRTLFEEQYDSEFRDYKSYIDQYLKYGCQNFHIMTRKNDDAIDDLFIRFSFITQVDLNINKISSCAFKAFYWRLDNNLEGNSRFDTRIID